MIRDQTQEEKDSHSDQENSNDLMLQLFFDGILCHVFAFLYISPSPLTGEVCLPAGRQGVRVAPSPSSPPTKGGDIKRSYHFSEINLKFLEIVSLTFFIKGSLSFKEKCWISMG